MRVVDLFSGGGGLSLGFNQAGFNIVAAIENWDPALKVYRENFQGHSVIKFNLSDVESSIKIINNYLPDIIIGGPPCQDFSSAGKRDEGLGRAGLTISFADIINQCKPKYFVMENVARAHSSATFKTAIEIFKKSGYGLTIKVLNASHCGCPQSRKRLIVIGSSDDKDSFLDELINKNLSKTPMTIRDYFGSNLTFEHYYRHPRSYARRGIFSVDEPSPTIRGVNRPIPKGYKVHEGDSCKNLDKLRPLTTQERALIQTFPKEFQFTGSKTDIEQVIGNAVPVKLAQYVAEHLMNYIMFKSNQP
jgi:DNA (cytosine-5)-methyltransferase 1